jgi:hypothetical protein
MPHGHGEDKEQTRKLITTYYYLPKPCVFIEVAFTRFYDLFYLKYFNFKDWMEYTLKVF